MPLDARYQAAHLAFFRSAWNDKDAIYVGFKGGDNAANHAHLDLGTFVLDALGQRWAVDLGPDDYDLPGYFGPERLTYERLKTSGQNTLLMDGADQDPKAVAPLTSYRSSADGGFAIADLTAAYAGSGATRVHRGVSLRDNRTRVLIQDEVETSRAVELAWTMHTQAAVEVQGDRALLTPGRRRPRSAAALAGRRHVHGGGRRDPAAPATGLGRAPAAGPAAGDHHRPGRGPVHAASEPVGGGAGHRHGNGDLPDLRHGRHRCLGKLGAYRDHDADPDRPAAAGLPRREPAASRRS